MSAYAFTTISATLALLSFAPLPAGECAPDLGPVSTERFVEQALDRLRDAGYDPSDFRLTLRLEDQAWPDRGSLGSKRVTSVVFLPRSESAGYPLRVHPANPCALSWLWNPEAFSNWQRSAIENASAALRQHRPGVWEAEPPTDLDVIESRDRLLVRLWRSRESTPSLQVILRKPDLEVLGVER